MNLSENKIREARENLARQEAELEAALVSAKSRDRKGIEETLVEVRERKAALEKIIMKNSFSLRHVRQKIFVSTNFRAGGAVPQWVRNTLKRAALIAESRGARYDYVYGSAVPGGDFQQAILQGIVDCQCFLSLVGAGKKIKSDEAEELVRPYLQEEIGVAFALGKPIVVAVQEPIDPARVGLLYGENRQRIVFPVGAGWEEKLAERLSDALQTAPRAQLQTIGERRRIVKSLFL